MMDSGDSGSTNDTGGTNDTGETTDTGTTTDTGETTDSSPTTDSGTIEASTGPTDTVSSGGPSDATSSPGKGGVEGLSGGLDTKGTDLNAPADSKSFDALATQAKNNAVEHAKSNSSPERQAELNAIKDGPNNARLADTPRSGILGGHNLDSGAIVCKNGLSNKQAAHVAQHEFTHKTSFQDTKVTETETSTITERTSGIRSLTRETSKSTGETTVKSDINRSLNEGITEREALATEKEAYGKVTDCGLNCYTLNMDYASQLETLVGRDKITDAYYNGNLDNLTNAVNELAKDEAAWTSLNAKLDSLCASREGMTAEQLAQIENTRTELDTLMARMAENKATIEAAKQNGGK